MAGAHPEPPAGDQQDGSRRRFLTVLGKAGLVTVGGLTVPILASGTPASAHAITGPTGCGGWDNNHVICNGCSVSRGNIVRLWQALIWTFGAEGALGTSFTSFVDGDFGPNTARATRDWQDWQNIGIDGVVGPQSWGTMRCQLAFKRTLNGYNYYEYSSGNRALIGLRRTVATGLWYYRVFRHIPDSAGAHGYRITSHS